MEINGLKNIIKEATCFKSNEPTLIDNVLTTNANRVASTIDINTGLSHFHNLVGMATKVSFPRVDKSMITYKSYRKFDDDIFQRDIAHAPFHVAEIFDDLDDKFWFYKTPSNELLNYPAPLKNALTKSRAIYERFTERLVIVKLWPTISFLSGAAQILYGKYSVSAGTRPPK